MSKGSGSGTTSTDINMVQREEVDKKEFDGHYVFSIVPSMDGVSVLDYRFRSKCSCLLQQNDDDKL